MSLLCPESLAQREGCTQGWYLVAWPANAAPIAINEFHHGILSNPFSISNPFSNPVTNRSTGHDRKTATYHTTPRTYGKPIIQSDPTIRRPSNAERIIPQHKNMQAEMEDNKGRPTNKEAPLPRGVYGSSSSEINYIILYNVVLVLQCASFATSYMSDDMSFWYSNLGRFLYERSRHDNNSNNNVTRA